MTVALLLFGLGSDSFPLTVAVFVSVPGVVVVTTTVMRALSPVASLPRLQLTVPPFGLEAERVQLPRVVATELNLTLLGSGSVTVTPTPSPGPLLVSVSV
jgi:hypothetical protein